VDLSSFASCPLASRFIDTREDALSYYAHRLAGDRPIAVKGAEITIRFNPEEIHLFTDERTPCPACDIIRRDGRSREVRCFSRDRARRLDDILDTLDRAARVHRAKTPGGLVVYGPAGANMPRQAVVIGPGAGVWYVRTAYPVSAKAFVKACRSERPAQWPPKK
jgi:hypothetical protein